MRKSGSPDYSKPPVRFHVPIDTRTPDPNAPPPYARKPISNYEGFKRLDKSLEKGELRDKAREKLCDVCGRRCRAWRIVPATFGHKIAGGPFSSRKFVLCCDHGPDGCASRLTRAGVHLTAVEEAEAMERLGLVLP